MEALILEEVKEERSCMAVKEGQGSVMHTGQAVHTTPHPRPVTPRYIQISFLKVAKEKLTLRTPRRLQIKFLLRFLVRRRGRLGVMSPQPAKRRSAKN